MNILTPYKNNNKYEQFLKLRDYYVTNVELTNNGLKLYINIKPMKVVDIEVTKSYKTRIDNFVGEPTTTKTGKLKTGKKIKKVFDYFLTYQDACVWYDAKIAEAQVTIKENINLLIERYNTLEDEKINLRSKKLDRLCPD